MSTRRLSFALALALAFGAGSAVAETPGLGKPIAEADIKAWDIAILPDGTGLPPGSGTPAQGAPIYAQKCAMCHGENGVNPARGYVPMVGAHTFDRIDAPKTVTYYGHATTLFDIIRRAMPYQMPTDADRRRGLCALRLHPRAQQDHRRERGDGRADAAEGEDAEPGQLHHPVPGRI